MAERKKIVAGNWKMNMQYDAGIALAKEIIGQEIPQNVNVVFCPPFPFIRELSTMVKGNVFVGGQNCHQEEKGAYTGEVSADLLQSTGATHVILGHSERREYFKEDAKILAKKTNMALSKGLTPIFCCGEVLAIREKGTHIKHVSKQLRDSLFHLDAEAFQKIVIAYEPVWAIGTGLTASPEQAQEMHFQIRELIRRKYGKRVANKISILYGGSCNAKNAQTLFAQADVDGGLIGGASLKADEFLTIIGSF